MRWLNQLRQLAAQIDPRWLAVISHPKLEDCGLQFQFQCPKRWDRLKPTGDPKTRFCDTCKKNVHYCETLREAATRAANGHCVALTITLTRHPCLARPPQPEPPKHIARARRTTQPIRLPPGARPTTPPLVQPLRSVRPPVQIRLTPDMIERVGRLSVAGRVEVPEPEPAPVSPPAPEQPERRGGERPEWKQKRRKSRRRNRHIQRENWEEVE
jgi:hypothetical protein